MQEKTTEKIAFVFPAFPNLHQTFVLWEVLALEERGVDIEIFSIKRPSTSTQQPEGRELAARVSYLPSAFNAEVWRANVGALVSAPLRYFGLFARLCASWWEDRAAGREWKNRTVSADAPDRQQSLGERLHGWYNRSPFLYLLKSIWLVPIAVYFGAVLKKRGIDRVHCHWASYSTTIGLICHWMYGIPFSFTAHAYDIYLVPRLVGAKVRQADYAVTCARVNATFLRALAGSDEGKIIVNYHGVSLDRFKPVYRASADGEVPTIVTCGRLEPYKGHHILLRACGLLETPVRCVLIGEGPQRAALEALADELGIGDRVELTGPLPQARLAEIYGQADLFVLASVIFERGGKRDVIPNVLAEAMAMRLPVVASAISGIGELIEDGVDGRLVAPNDAEALAGVIAELLADDEQRQRLAHQGAAKVAEIFDRSVNIEELAQLFRDPTSARQWV